MWPLFDCSNQAISLIEKYGQDRQSTVAIASTLIAPYLPSNQSHEQQQEDDWKRDGHSNV
jgi:hypothetical protein